MDTTKRLIEMARSRNIKPGFFENEDLTEMSPYGRLLYIGLWMHADGHGKLEYRPRRLKMQILPCDDVSAEELLSDLERLGFIETYECSLNPGKRVIRVPSFLKHQNPHVKERNKPSQWSNPPGTPQDVVNESEPKKAKKSDTSPENSGLVSGESSASTVPARKNQGQNQTCPDESLLLNNESLLLNPELNNMSGKPDPDPQVLESEITIPGKPKRKPTRPNKDHAIELLGHLNKRSGRNYEPVDSNLKLIEKILTVEGRTPDLVRQVIDHKCEEWGSSVKMSEYLRPKTLFSETNFAQYVGSIGAKQTNDAEFDAWLRGEDVTPNNARNANTFDGVFTHVQ